MHSNYFGEYAAWMVQSDEEVARKVQNNDAEAFGLLVERYEDKLMRYARKFLRDPDDAKDIVQEVFIKAYENIQSFDATLLAVDLPHRAQ